MTRDRSSPADTTPPEPGRQADRRSVTLARFEPRRDLRPSEAVVDAVAAAERTDPREVRPRLVEAVDTDSLDALFSNSSPPARFSFRHGNYVVDVHADGWVRVREATDDEPTRSGDRFEGDLSSG